MSTSPLVGVDGIVRLETMDAAFVGWARLPLFAKPPDVLLWGEAPRIFRLRGIFTKGPAAKSEDPHYALYREVFSFYLPQQNVTSERPAELADPVEKKK